MEYSDRSYNLRIELDTKDCELTADQIQKMEEGLDPLARLVRDFPVSDLYITVIHHPRSDDYHVKTSLVLPGKTLFTGDRDVLSHPAYERCLRKLVRKVEAYKSGLGNRAEISKQRKGTHRDVVPTRTPEPEAIAKAIEDGDYAAFRKATDVYEEPVRKRVGRWIQRYPDVESQIGDSLTIADLVEEVFLNAFERYDQRPATVHAGEWLESLVDPSIKYLLQHLDQEIENIRFAQTLQETQPEQESKPEED